MSKGVIGASGTETGEVDLLTMTRDRIADGGEGFRMMVSENLLISGLSSLRPSTELY